MLSTSVRPAAEEFLLKESLARRHSVDRDSIILFNETGLFLTELFKAKDSLHLRIIAAAPVMADIFLAADRADGEVVNCELSEPSCGDIDSITSIIKSNADIIYLANPNRLTGASYANSHLKTLASMVPEGLLIIDEYYHDFSRMSSLPLLNKFQNLVVLRVLENWTNTGHPDCGYAIINEQLLGNIEFNSNSFRLERVKANKCLEIIDDRKTCETRVELIQKQALHVAKALTGFGINCRLSPADFILFESDKAGEIQNYLSSRAIRIERLAQDGPLGNFLSYQITAGEQDVRLIEAFSRMSAELSDSQIGNLRTQNSLTGSTKVRAKFTTR